MVGGGNLFVWGDAGKLTSGVTRESHRGRGVHSAVIAARAQAAAEAGCRWLVGHEVAQMVGSQMWSCLVVESGPWGQHTSVGDSVRIAAREWWRFAANHWATTANRPFPPEGSTRPRLRDGPCPLHPSSRGLEIGVGGGCHALGGSR
jgi:hypothetical protein